MKAKDVLFCKHDQQLDRRGTQKLVVGLRDEKHIFRARFARRVSAKMRARAAGSRKAENTVKTKRTTNKKLWSTLYLVPNHREVAHNMNRKE